MTEAFWWYVLAGFLLGFCVSTLWEWLYFRRRRMTIRNQRIAELEATVRTYAAATGAPPEPCRRGGVGSADLREPRRLSRNGRASAIRSAPGHPAAGRNCRHSAPGHICIGGGEWCARGTPARTLPRFHCIDCAGRGIYPLPQPPATGGAASANVAYNVAHSVSPSAAGAELTPAAQQTAAQPAQSAEALASLGVVAAAYQLREDVRDKTDGETGDETGDAERISAAVEAASVSAGDAAPDAGLNRVSSL